MLWDTSHLPHETLLLQHMLDQLEANIEVERVVVERAEVQCRPLAKRKV